MKKILTLLGALSFVATIPATVVACEKEKQHNPKNEPETNFVSQQKHQDLVEKMKKNSEENLKLQQVVNSQKTKIQVLGDFVRNKELEIVKLKNSQEELKKHDDLNKTLVQKENEIQFLKNSHHELENKFDDLNEENGILKKDLTSFINKTKNQEAQEALLTNAKQQNEDLTKKYDDLQRERQALQTLLEKATEHIEHQEMLLKEANEKNSYSSDKIED